MAHLTLPCNFEPRWYQRPIMSYFDNLKPGDVGFASWIMHRRGGKDHTMVSQASKMMHRRIGSYWHCLPTYAQARKAVWENVRSDGKKLMDAVFPRELGIRKIDQQAMRIELKNGSSFQLIGADNYDALVGTNLVHCTFSEWPLTHPYAYDFIRPILRENAGTVAFIGTPRGYNHGYKTHETAEGMPGAFYATMDIEYTRIITPEDIALERSAGMPDELIQQEYYCSFSAANVGAILGRRIEVLDSQGRIRDDVVYAGGDVFISADLGRRDTAAWWFWEPIYGGFKLIDYVEGNGLDAEEWCDKLKEHCRAEGYRIVKVYLPHDAKTKTMAAKYSVIETFARAFECEIVPQTAVKDRVNAARHVVEACWFNKTKCAKGLEALRSWCFEWDEVRHVFSTSPQHDWASHPSDGFSYGAQVVSDFVKPKDRGDAKHTGASYAFSLEQLFEAAKRRGAGERR